MNRPIRLMFVCVATCVFSAGRAIAQPATAPTVSLPTSAPATQTDDAAAAVIDVLRDYNQAVDRADIPAILARVKISSDLQQRAIGVMSKLAATTHGLYSDTLNKFGADALAKAGVGKESFPPVFPRLPVDQLKVNVEGDRATLSVEGGSALPVTLVRDGAEWKLNADDFLPPFTEQQLAEQTAAVTAGIEVLEQTRADLATPALRTPDEVIVLMQHRVRRAFERTAAAAMGAASQPSE